MKKLKIFVIIFLTLMLIPISINFYVIYKNAKKIYNQTEIQETYDIALVLGCSALKDGSPSKMLKDRLNTAIYLYENKMVEKILISGDHEKTYSEIDAMYNYLLDNGIENENILKDYTGYSTSESLINFSKEYKDKSVIIVSQKYHLYRALDIASHLDLDATGVHAKLINYNGQLFREIREILARNKDFLIFNILK